jgi:hypothetical protein
MFFGRKRHPAVTEPSQPFVELTEKLDYVLSRFARHDHALALVLKGQLKIMTVFSELVTEITGHIATEQSYIDAVTAYQDSVKSLVAQLESGQDTAGALDALKAQDAKLATAKTTLADSQSKITPPSSNARCKRPGRYHRAGSRSSWHRYHPGSADGDRYGKHHAGRARSTRRGPCSERNHRCSSRTANRRHLTSGLHPASTVALAR